MNDNVSMCAPCTIGVLLHDFRLGGTERVAIRLANAWSLMGCKVHVLVGSLEGSQRALLDHNVNVIAASLPFWHGWRYSPAGLGRWVAANTEGMDAFYLPGNSYFPAVPLLSRTGARIYTTITNPLWRSDKSLVRNVVFRLLTRRRLQKAAGVISMSPALLRQDRQLLGRQLTMTMIRNAPFNSAPQPDAAHRRPWHICAVARLVLQKNIMLLLRSIALLKDLPVTLSIAGDGRLKEELSSLTADPGLQDRVTFLGEVPSAASCLAEAEVLMLTSNYEGYPAVVVEALAAGTFVISNNCSPGLSDILTTPNLGTIAMQRTPEAFASALRQFFFGEARTKTARRISAVRALLQSHMADAVALQHLRFMGLVEASSGLQQEGSHRELTHGLS